MRLVVRIGLILAVALTFTISITAAMSLASDGTSVGCVPEVFYFGQQLFLVCTPNGLFRATDGNWHKIFGPSGWSEVKAIANGPIYMYDAYSTHEVRRSLDEGQTWDLMGIAPFANYVGADHIFPAPITDTVFLGEWDYPFTPDNRGIYKSVNGGITWTKVLSGGNGRYVAVSPGFAQDGTAFAALDEYHASLGIWKTVDEGETWFPVNNGLYVGGCIPGQLWVAVSPQFPQDQTAFTSDCTGFYKTVNGGQVWSKIAGLVVYEAVALSPNYNNDQTLLIGNHDTGLYLSQDGGLSEKQIWSGSVFAWGLRRQGPVGTTLTPPSPPPSMPHRTYLPLVSLNGGVLEFWVVVPKGQPIRCYLYRSRDYGTTWEEVPVFEATHWSYLPVVSH